MPSISDIEARSRVGPKVEEDRLPDLSALEPDANIVVEAAAGSGKTTALIGRMVALVRSGMSPRDLAAITFTREASGEMRAAFQKGLRATLRVMEEEGDPQAGRMQDALREADRCFIDTIHAFCTQILREHAEQAGLPPGFTVLEPGEDEELKRRVWNEYLDAFSSDGLEETLQDLGVDVADLYDFYADWCGRCDVSMVSTAPETLCEPDLSAAMDTLWDFIGAWYPIAPETDPDDLTELFQRARHLQRQGALDEKPLQYRLLRDVESLATSEDRMDVISYTHWDDTSESERLIAEEDSPLDDLLESIQPAIQRWQQYVHAHATAFVEEAVRDRFYEAGRSYGTLTFQHLLLYTRDLLRESPAVREELQDRYQAILVDEFQDTDPIQAEILFYLTGENTGETDWRQCDPAPGRLFIVGDGKQSIYRFRRADHRVFREVSSLIEHQPEGRRETFYTNFRSTPEVCGAVNDSFAPLMPGPSGEEGPQVEYVPLKPHKSEQRGPGLCELQVDHISHSRAKDIATEEAGRIASFIKSTCTEGALTEAGRNVFGGEQPSYGDFMILARTAKRFPQYARHLAKADVPFTIAGSKQFGADVAVRAVLDLLALAFRPGDSAIRVSYLAGLLVGLSDRELYQVRYGLEDDRGHRLQFDQPYSPSDIKRGSAPEELLRVVREAYRRETETRRRLEEEPVSSMIEWLIEETGLMAHAALDHHGDLEAGSLLRLQHEAQSLESQGNRGWAVAQALREMLGGEREAQAMTHREGQENVVRLMTVHQAKGLDAPVVFLVDPYDSRGGKSDPQYHISRPEAGKARLHMPVRRPTSPHSSEMIGAPSSWHEYARDEEKRHQQAEEERIAYVAATRAEQLLVVSRYHSNDGIKADPEKAPWWPLNRAFEERDAPELRDLFETGGSTQSPVEELPSPSTRSTWEERREPTYDRTTVTGLLPAEHEPLGSGEERQTSNPEAFGTAVHRLFEWAVRRHGDVPGHGRRRPVVRMLMEEVYPAHSDADVERALGMLDGFLASQLWNDLQQAHRVLVEHPIAWKTEDGAVARGTIDLLFENRDGWNLVEYKTDTIKPSELSRQRLDDHKYVCQMRKYENVWVETTDNSISGLYIYFAHIDTNVKV
jgi:ATP-dependent helicase/nuclease subunit A